MRETLADPYLWVYGFRVKTTLEIPDSLFRKAKTYAASQSMTMKQLFTEALEQKLGAGKTSGYQVLDAKAPWMAGFGKLADLADENDRILGLIEDEFETIDPSDI